MPFRLLMAIPAVAPIYGGPSKSVCELAEAIGRRGVQVDLVSTDANGTARLTVPLATWVERDYYRIRFFACSSIRHNIWSNSLARWLWQHVSSYSIVHLNSVFSILNVPFFWCCRYYKIPYVVAPRGMLNPWALGHKAYKKKLYFPMVERPALGRASAIHALSVNELKKIDQLRLGSPLVAIPNGIRPEEFQADPDPALFFERFPHLQGKTIILFLGRIDPKKGLDLLAPAFAQVLSRFPNAHLVVAGADNIGFLPTAQQYFRAAGCLAAVSFPGLLGGELKRAALAAADVYVAPSYSEGFSMSVLEAMASGLPCVITQGCNFDEAALAGVAHVVPTEAGAIAQGLADCLRDLPAARAMGARARQFVLDNYTWDRVAAQLIEVYGAILERRPLPTAGSP
jgi:glycosyltransferase involved in cell wall biosynthesis